MCFELRDVISFVVKVVQINHWGIVMNKTRNNDQSYVQGLNITK
jgi:hypothetical protein